MGLARLLLTMTWHFFVGHLEEGRYFNVPSAALKRQLTSFLPFVVDQLTHIPPYNMSIASTSSLRSLRRPFASVLSASSRSASTDSSSSAPTPYQPRPFSRSNDSYSSSQRPPRPASPVFFTGRITLTTEMDALTALLRSAQAELRQSHLYPLPPALTLPSPATTKWSTREELKDLFGEIIRSTEQRRLLSMLNELHRTSYLAELGDKPDLASKITAALQRFSNREVRSGREVKKVEELDAAGRANGNGKRKTASARVWIVPSKSALEFLDAPAKQAGLTLQQQAQNQSTAPLPTAEVLVNHLPLSQYFSKVKDRTAAIRPLKLTGLLGAYNVHALATGGGNTGQAEAVALGLARALVVMRPETRAVLYAGGSCEGRQARPTEADIRWRIAAKPEDGREEEDELAQGHQGGKSA